MNLSPSQLGALRSLAILVGFAVVQTIVSFFTNPANATSVFGVGISGLVVLVAGALEQTIASHSGKAMFGAVKVN